jgi:tetratricopeptide (TPR) repeat protein
MSEHQLPAEPPQEPSAELAPEPAAAAEQIGATQSGASSAHSAGGASSASSAGGASSASSAGAASTARAASSASSARAASSATDERLLAARLFDEARRLMEQENRTREDNDRMTHAAHASRYHWGQVPDATQAHLARGEWQISRVYAVLGRSEPALHHARRMLEICRHHGIGDRDLAFAYEALARAHAVAGEAGKARYYTDEALAAAKDIAADDDRARVLAELGTVPGLPRYW